MERKCRFLPLFLDDQNAVYERVCQACRTVYLYRRGETAPPQRECRGYPFTNEDPEEHSWASRAHTLSFECLKCGVFLRQGDTLLSTCTEGVGPCTQTEYAWVRAQRLEERLAKAEEMIRKFTARDRDQVLRCQDMYGDEDGV